MAGLKIDGTTIAKNIREGLSAEIQKAQESNPRFKPSFVIFQGKQYDLWALAIMNWHRLTRLVMRSWRQIGFLYGSEELSMYQFQR